MEVGVAILMLQPCETQPVLSTPGCLVASLALALTWDSQRKGCLQAAGKSRVGASGVREASGSH